MPGRRRRTRLRVLLRGLLVLMVVPIGVAHLAQNVQQPSSAGSAAVAMSTPTRLAATDNAKINVAQEDGHEYYQFTNLSASLTAGGTGVAGQEIRFVIQGVSVCSDVTDHRGIASCVGSTRAAVVDFTTVPQQFTAVFGGHGPLQPASITMDFRKITGGGSSSDQGESDE